MQAMRTAPGVKETGALLGAASAETRALLLGQAQPIMLPRGAAILAQETPAEVLYVLLQGSVGLSTVEDGGVPTMVEILAPGEAFSIPPGGTRVLENSHCENQAFALGKHFGMQCHVEMTGELVREWLRGGAREIDAARGSPGVQRPEQIERDLERRLEALHAVADRIYDHWVEGLSR